MFLYHLGFFQMETCIALNGSLQSDVLVLEFLKAPAIPVNGGLITFYGRDHPAFFNGDLSESSRVLCHYRIRSSHSLIRMLAYQFSAVQQIFRVLILLPCEEIPNDLAANAWIAVNFVNETYSLFVKPSAASRF